MAENDFFSFSRPPAPQTTALTEGKRRAGMGKPFAVGASLCAVGGVAGALKLPASSGSWSPDELR